MTDTVFVRALEVETIIGIYEWERQNLQPVIIDLDMAWDIRQAAATDDIEKTLDYKQVCDSVTAFVSSSSFQLIETMAEHMAALIMHDFSVTWVRVRIAKPRAIEQTSGVGIEIERGSR